jgi:hypothetical protein
MFNINQKLEIVKNIDYVFFLHKIITIGLGIAPYIIPIYYLYYYIYFFFGVISHWYFLNGRCFMVYFQQKKNNKILFSNTLNSINIYDLFIVSNILFSFYRLGNIFIGILLIPIFISLNLYFYNNYGFRLKPKNN